MGDGDVSVRIEEGDCRKWLATMPDNCVDSIVTDPPYHLTTGKKGGTGPASVNLESPYGRARVTTGFMGMTWDGGDVAYDVELWRQCLRVLKPGGHLLSFGGSRTYHRMACAIEDAGFEIRDQIMWLYGSGFPKSHNGSWGGTALKPAHEPIVVARKPLIGTVAANVAAHGTGGLNIDGCRIPSEESTVRKIEKSHGIMHGDSPRTIPTVGGSDAGRWPANIIHDGSDDVLAAFPNAPGQQGDLIGHSRDRKSLGIFGDMPAARDAIARGDSGSAARFFYCAKASKSDREGGCSELPTKAGGMVSNTSGQHITRRDGGEPGQRANHHPTVKPTALMRYLVRLVTPAAGIVLDPFTGSGSTGRAAVLEGFSFVGFEMTPEYVDIAKARIAHAESERAAQ